MKKLKRYFLVIATSLKKLTPFMLELAAIAAISYAGWEVYRPLGIFLAGVGVFYYAQGIK